MTTAPDSAGHDRIDRDPAFDRQARQLHAAALAQTSPRTLARLRDARRAATSATPRRLPGLAPWLAGGGVAAALALAVLLHPGLFTTTPATGAATAAAATASYGDPVEPLQEDPGFYLWLGSADATALAME